MREVAVAAVGFFDGVHLGHRKVIRTLVSAARERGEEAIVFSFWPHPRTVLQQDARELRLLSSLDEKREMLLGLGVDRVEVLPFSRKFAALLAHDFVSMLRDCYAVSHLIMGYDNRIGSDHRTAGELAVDGVTVETVSGMAVTTEPEIAAEGEPGVCHQEYRGHPRPDHPKKQEFFGDPGTSPFEGPIACDGRGRLSRRFQDGTYQAPYISATIIRKALAEGDIEAANWMLGYCYGLRGVVVAGNRMGRTIGFPTANLKLYEPLKLLPGGGVYTVNVEVIGGKYKGMCNIGTRPTVGGNVRTIETNIFDFDEDIYGLPLNLQFVKRLRNEVCFPSLEALKHQLEKDREAAKASFEDKL